MWKIGRKNSRKKQHSLRDLWKNSKTPSIYAVGVQEEEERELGTGCLGGSVT